ncbi:MAG: hypothetical protein RR203_07820 [Synergistaceae bacterium]
MKRLLNLGFTQGVSSCLPIFMWFAIGIVYGNSSYSNMFVITYAFQFMEDFFQSVLVKGCLLYENKHGIKDRNYTWSAIFTSSVILFAVFLVFILNADSFFRYMKLDGSVYYPFFVFSLLQLFLVLPLCGIVSVLQFDGKEEEGFRITLRYYLIQLLGIVLPGLFIENKIICIAIALLLSAGYVVLLCCKYVKMTAYRPNIFIGCKYQMNSILGNISMFILYFFGMGSVYGDSVLIIGTYNLMLLCTDTQWDMLRTAIEVDTSLEVCKGNFEERKRVLFRNAVVFSLMLLLSSVVMLFIGSLICPVNVKYLILFFLIENGFLPIFAVRYVMMGWVAIERPDKYLFYVLTIVNVIRVVLTLTLQSVFAVSFALFIANAVLGNGLQILLYLKARRNLNASAPVKQADVYS